MNLKTLQHSFLFLTSFALILLSEIYHLNSKFLILTTTPLFFLILHLKYFSKNFLKEIIFIALSFSMAFTCELFTSNINIYHFGLIDLPQYTWPPPWVAALWMILPAFLCTSLNIPNGTSNIVKAYFKAFLLYLIYKFGGKYFELIFFHDPNIQSALLFILVWSLLIRILFKLHYKIHHN